MLNPVAFSCYKNLNLQKCEDSERTESRKPGKQTKGGFDLARQKDENREKAKQLFLDSDGLMKNTEIAEALGIDSAKVRKWKCVDKWNDVLENKPKKRGGQKGNKNAKGHGAPVRNKNAETHGAYSKVYFDELSEDEKALIESVTLDTGENTLRELQSLASVLGALTAIGAVAYKIIKWFQAQEKQTTDIEDLKKQEKEDIKAMEDELCLLTYAVLACLKGLKEQGCNGPVTEAIGKIEKHINQKAHGQET